MQAIGHAPSFVATIVIAASILYSLSLNNDPKMNVVMPADGAAVTRDEKEYYLAAQRLINGSLLNKTKITINTKSIENKLVAHFPELEKAEISLPISLRRPVVTLYPAKFALILTTGNSQLTLDSGGRAMLSNEDLSLTRSFDLPVVTDESGLAAEKGRQLLTEDEVSFISSLYKQLKVRGLEVESLTLPRLPSELHLRLKGVPYFVKFNLRTNSREAAGTFLAAKAKLKADSVEVSEYIDVRVEEKAYYK